MVDLEFHQTGRRTARRWRGKALHTAPFLAGLYLCAALAPTGGMPPLIFCASLAMAGFLIALSAIDLASFRIPDELSLGLAVTGLAITALLDPTLLPAHIAMAIACLGGLSLLGTLYRRYRGHDGFGQGDTKLLAASALWVGFSGFASILLWASATGLAHFILLRLAGKRIGATSRIAFGPHIAFGLWLVWLYGPLA